MARFVDPGRPPELNQHEQGLAREVVHHNLGVIDVARHDMGDVVLRNADTHSFETSSDLGGVGNGHNHALWSTGSSLRPGESHLPVIQSPVGGHT